MTTKLGEVDVVIVGLGWTGGILAKELTEAGMQVLALEHVPVALVPRGTAVDLRFLREVTRGLIETPRFYNEYPLVMLERADAETWLREPDFFVPRPLRGVWARSEGGPAAYRVLVTFARRDFLERICAGNFRVRVLGSDCAVVPRERDS
jgi:hypothetical protein